MIMNCNCLETRLPRNEARLDCLGTRLSGNEAAQEQGCLGTRLSGNEAAQERGKVRLSGNEAAQERGKVRLSGNKARLVLVKGHSLRTWQSLYLWSGDKQGTIRIEMFHILHN